MNKYLSMGNQAENNIPDVKPLKISELVEYTIPVLIPVTVGMLLLLLTKD